MSGYLGSWKIDDLVTFAIVTTRVDTGAATDADAAPAYRVYEDETSTPILTGTMALLDSSNTAGFYSEQITLSAANGFEKGKSYNIYISATVNSVAGATVRNLQIEAEVDANTVSASNVSSNMVQIAGVAISTSTAQLGVNVVNWKGTAAATVDTAGYPVVTIKDGTGAGEINTNGGKVVGVELVDVLTTYTGNTVQTGDSFARLGAPAGASHAADILVIDNLVDDLESRIGSPSDLGSGATVAGNLVDIESQTDDIGAAGAGLTNINLPNQTMDIIGNITGNLSGSVGSVTSGVTVTTNNDKTGYALSSAGIQAIWDALTSALSTASSIGKLLVDNINATISSRMATYTQPTGFLAATFPTTVASTTNITAGTITTVTNLTNAPTAGDLTATMKTSVNAEVVDALATDTYAEPTGVPAATAALTAKIGYLYMALRNAVTVTATKKQFFDDGGAAEWEKDLSDDGTTYTESEGNAP